MTGGGDFRETRLRTAFQDVVDHISRSWIVVKKTRDDCREELERTLGVDDDALNEDVARSLWYLQILCSSMLFPRALGTI